MHKLHKRIGVFLCYLLSLTGSGTYAQSRREVQGWVQDSLGRGLLDAYVTLHSPQDTLVTHTGKEGRFAFQNVKASAFTLIITHVGLQTSRQPYSAPTHQDLIQLAPIQLLEQPILLGEVTIRTLKPITIKEDTIQYDAMAYSVRKGAPVAALIQKLPGISIDKDGNLTAYGKSIGKIRLNGKDISAGEMQKILENLPAYIVENIQVINDYGEQARYTHIKSGEPAKTLNIQLQADKNSGAFGQIAAGAGNSSRYLASGYINSFDTQRQVSASGDINNVNAPTGNSLNKMASMTNTADGIMTLHSFGLNYQDAWSKTLTSTANYQFTGTHHVLSSASSQQSIFQNEVIRNEQTNQSENNQSNHLINYGLDYKPNERNMLKMGVHYHHLAAALTRTNAFVVDRQGGDQPSLTRGSTTSNASIYTRTVTTDLMFLHSFAKKGRAFTLSSNFMYTLPRQAQQNNTTSSVVLPDSMLAESEIYQRLQTDNRGTNVNVNATYVEPLGKNSFLQASYTLTNLHTKNNRVTRTIDPATHEERIVDSLSNRYQYSFINQRIGLNYQLTQKRYNATLGIFAQPIRLEGETLGSAVKTQNTHFNIIPEARLYVTLVPGKTLGLHYQVTTNQPDFTQLQPVTDLSNPQYPITGNPNLKPEQTHQASFNYSQFNAAKGNSLFSNLSFSQTQNKIVTNVLNKSGNAANSAFIQETQYLNTDGYVTITGSSSYAHPFAERKLIFLSTNNLAYSNNISFINTERNLGSNWLLQQDFRVRLDLKDRMDAELRGGYTYTVTRYSNQTALNTYTHSLELSLTGKNFIKNWILGYDCSKMVNSGFSQQVLASPILLSAYVEYSFLKSRQASIRLQGFDLLNQNVGVYRNAIGNMITDTRNSRLTRYVLLTFSWRLQKFKASHNANQGNP
ncbi:MAG: outer membrane beta-barrel protein [Bacteroidota bacterium]